MLEDIGKIGNSTKQKTQIYCTRESMSEIQGTWRLINYLPEKALKQLFQAFLLS